MSSTRRIELLESHRPVVVVGGGQAGLSMSWWLVQRGIDHLVLEQQRVGYEWRERRWDSFCMVTPNWQCRLPGFPYAGDDPHGFIVREEIVKYLEAYAASFAPPLIEGVTVTGLARARRGFALTTTAGELSCDQVVVATGGYHHPAIPRLAERLPRSLTQLHSSEYASADALSAGAVLVVGTGQSGCQIAEDLHLAGRRVHLAVGGAPRVSRFYRGRDVTDWLEEMGHYDMPVTEHSLGDRVRLQANHYETGRDGGRDIDLREFARGGMELYGRLVSADGAHLRFGDDLATNLDHADDVLNAINATIDEYIETCGLDVAPEPPYQPVWQPRSGPRLLDLDAAEISVVVWCVGFRRDYRWIETPVFDGAGYPRHERGVTGVPGLYFLGLPWLHTWGSGRFASVGRDAEYLIERIEEARSRDADRRTVA